MKNFRFDSGFKMLIKGRYENPLCHCFGHKWNFYKTSDNAQLRACRVCHDVHEYKTIPVYGSCWVGLVQRTQKGAKEYMKEHNIET